MKKVIKDWSDSTNDRTKLQHVYLLLTAGLIITAGLVSLLNPELGRTLVALALGAVAIFAVNGIVWAILYTMLYPRQQEALPKKSSKRS